MSYLFGCTLKLFDIFQSQSVDIWLTTVYTNRIYKIYNYELWTDSDTTVKFIQLSDLQNHT